MSGRAMWLASLGLLVSGGYALGAGSPKPTLTLNPSILTADDDEAAAPGLLMTGLDKTGVGKPLEDAGLKIYGWIEGGYTYSHRHHSASDEILPGPYNHEFGNHFMLNQLDLRFEREVDPKKLDVGGMVELMYGSDAARLHSTGLGFNGSDPTDDDTPPDSLAVANLHPIWQFDITQAYVDVNLPVGNGLKIRVGKFVTLLGYETVDPGGNLFYSHSWLFSDVPTTQTGILGFYTINDQWSVILGVTRGWDISLEDNNGAIDVLGQVAFTPNKQWSIDLTYSVGPEDNHDNSHYRTAINPQITWQVTDNFKLAADVLYIYDGGLNAPGNGVTHAYGDVWGAALYASYTLNDYLTLNGRAEKMHNYSDTLGALGDTSATLGTAPFVPTVNVYEATLGVTVTPLPKDPIGKNLTVRPEIRYDWSEDHVFTSGGRAFQDQLTFAADVIFKF